MNDGIRELYQEVILDHGTHPRNVSVPEHANRTGSGYNPLCGDQVTVDLRLEGQVVQEIGCHGQGCAICTAAGSTMTEVVKGKRVDEIRRLFADYRALVTGQAGTEVRADLGKLAVFAGVAAFPMRVKCATLPWHTLEAALEQNDEVATSEEDGNGRA